MKSGFTHINLILSSIITICLTACGGSSSNSSQPIDDIGLDDGFESLRSTAKQQLAASIAPAMSIAIYKDGEIVFAEAFGTKQAGGSEAADSNSLFQLGSTTKMFTALASLQLVEVNNIALNSKLLDLLPEIEISQNKADGWQEINVHHLLTHQGGFEDFIDWENDSIDLLSFALSNYPSEFDQMNPAGRFANYSNPNWSYLGAIIQDQAAMPYEEVMKQNVFTPLGMSRTTMKKTDVSNDGNYVLGSGVIINNGNSIEGSADSLNNIHQSLFSIPAGSYTWSTPSEMLKMADFLLNGNNNILSDDLQQKMTLPQVDLEIEIPLTYGYGLELIDGFEHESNWYPVKRWSHGGNSLAYSSMFWVLPEENIAVSILSSGRDTDFRETMMAALSSVTTLPDVIDIPTKPIETELFDNHVGRYEDIEDVVDITLENNQVRIDISSLNDGGIDYNPILEPVGGSVFRFTEGTNEHYLTFIPEVEGESSTYIRQREFVLIRNDNALQTETQSSSKIIAPQKKSALIPNELIR
jgi:CubicO group peptidase (beta-lactamase class C family)